MPETWVHGNAFIPRLYGPDNLANVGGIAWSDQQGLKDGGEARFVMRDERFNYFHAIIPVVGTQQLQEIRVEFSSTYPVLKDAWVHHGINYVANGLPQVNTVGTFSTATLGGINQAVNRGICVSLGFDTFAGAGIGQGQISFYAAGAIFA